MVKKHTLLVEDVENMLFMFKKENVLPVVLVKQKKLDNTTGQETNKKKKENNFFVYKLSFNPVFLL